jgi:hypothetical protein
MFCPYPADRGSAHLSLMFIAIPLTRLPIYVTIRSLAGTDQARRSEPCRAKRSRTLQARSVWTGYRAQTRNNAHEQAFANIIRLMSVHQRNLVVRARSIWTDFLCCRFYAVSEICVPFLYFRA